MKKKPALQLNSVTLNFFAFGLLSLFLWWLETARGRGGKKKRETVECFCERKEADGRGKGWGVLPCQSDCQLGMKALSSHRHGVASGRERNFLRIGEL